jgi:hypothetical protein
MNPAQRILDSIPAPPFNVVNRHNHRLIAQVNSEKVLILDKKRISLIGIFGINVPPFLREKFNGRSIINRDDPLFYEAFITAECWNLIRAGYIIERAG